MRILVTGAAGFVGRALVRELVADHEVVALDRTCSGLDCAQRVEGDIADPQAVARAVGGGCDAVIHLATLPGGATEQDPELGWRVNVEGSRALLSAIGKSADRPRFVFASSIAALGDPLPASVDDMTPLRPRLLYGAHKAMIEQWVAALTRRGAIEGISLRLSGIVARPPGPSGMKSAFMSDIFHAALERRPFTAPVSAHASMWIMSLQRVVQNLRFAAEAGLRGGEPHAFTLPAVRATMEQLAAEIARQTEADPASIDYVPDPLLEAGFGRLPPLQANAAEALGFSDDGSLASLVAAAIDHIRRGE